MGIDKKQNQFGKILEYFFVLILRIDKNPQSFLVPIAHESMGSWAPNSLKFLKNLGSRITESTGEKRARSFLFQSLSMNLQRGNALCVMGTVAHHRKLREIYHLGSIPTEED